jgi:hypothetical protein
MREGDVTIIPERRGDTDFIALFLAGILLLAAWRGAENAPAIALVLAAIAAVVIGGWIYLRMKPRMALTIGPDEIVFGRPNERRNVIARGATPGVRIEQAGTSGWFLVAGDGDDPAARTTVSLIGFDPRAVADACEANGWPVTVDPALQR